jgi:hypothetical protein
LWNAQLVGPAFTCCPPDPAVIPSFHKYGTPACFKPSLAEALAAIRRYCTDWSMVAYFAVESDLGPGALIGGCHQSRCLLIEAPKVVDGGGREGRLVPLSPTVLTP